MTESTEARSSEHMVRVGPWWTLPLLIAASILANILIWAAALHFGPPELATFAPLTSPQGIILLTALGALGAYGLLWVLAQVLPRPGMVFVPVALLAMVVSLAPDLMIPPTMAGWSEFAVGTLVTLRLGAALVD